jgi:integrase/recombinase XerD
MAQRKAKKLPKFLQANEPEALLRATTRERDRLLLMTMPYLGLRNSEVCKLQVEDVDFQRKLLSVREGKGCKDRTLPLPARFIGPLRGWIGARMTGYVFPSPRGGRLTSRAVQLLVKRLAARAGLRDAGKVRKYHPHAFRHVFASRMLERGATLVEVKEALGHSSIGTTSIYLHANPDHLRAAMEI